jgi:hypothetical protein
VGNLRRAGAEVVELFVSQKNFHKNLKFLSHARSLRSLTTQRRNEEQVQKQSISFFCFSLRRCVVA